MRQNRWFRIVTVGAGLTLVAGACGGRDDGGAVAEDDDGTETTDGEGGEEPGGENAGGTPDPVAGFDGTTIRLGALTPTSGIAAVIGNPLTAGNQAYFDYVNTELGGIAGQYPIEFVVRDTAYMEPTAVQEYNATKDDVVLYAQILGTPIVNALVETLTADGIVAAPASLDSFWVREQVLLPVGAPYQIQAANALDYWVNTAENGGPDTVMCSLIQDDPYGEAGQEGLDFAAENLGVELEDPVTFPAGNTDFTTQIGQLEGAGCEMVFFVALPSATGPALGKAAEVGFAPQWIGQSSSWIGLLAQSPIGPYLQENFLLASEGPNYGDESVPGMAELIRIQETYSEQAPDTYFNFGYLQGVAVVQVLEAAVANGDLSHEGIIEAMNSIEVFEYDGLSGDYQWGPPEDRDPPRTSTIFGVNPAAPIGLEAIAIDITSDAAESFEFE